MDDDSICAGWIANLNRMPRLGFVEKRIVHAIILVARGYWLSNKQQRTGCVEVSWRVRAPFDWLVAT